jgi:hypothetical protein
MIAPVHSLRVVFALSTLACSLILMLFVSGRVTWSPAFWLQVAAASAAICAASCALAFRRGRLRLDAVPLARLVPLYLRQLLFAYIATSLAITAVALAAVYGITRSAPNALALAVVAGLWLALWIAPGIACLTSWRRLRTVGAGEGRS